MKRTRKIMSVIMAIAIVLATTVSAVASPVGYGEELANAPTKKYSQKFTDVSKSYWAFSYIGEMAERGVLSGYPDGKFYPDNYVTRAEFAKIMTVAAGLTISNSTYSSYNDIDPDDWCSPYVEAARYYLSGYVSNGKNLYLPDNNALREDIAVALVKLKGYDTTGYDLSILKTMFTDWQSISDGARKYVAVAVEQGLISGYEDGTFKGQAGITRAETATLLWRAYQYGNGNKNFEQDIQTKLEKEVVNEPVTPKKEETKNEKNNKYDDSNITWYDEDEEDYVKPDKKPVIEEEEEKEPEVKYDWKVETIKSAIGGINEILAVPGGVSYRTGNKIYEVNDSGKKKLIFDADKLEYLKDEEVSKNFVLKTTLYSYGYNQYDDCYYAAITQNSDGYLYNVTNEEIKLETNESSIKSSCFILSVGTIKTPGVSFFKNGDYIIGDWDLTSAGNTLEDNDVPLLDPLHFSSKTKIIKLGDMRGRPELITESGRYNFINNNLFIANGKIYHVKDNELFSLDPIEGDDEFVMSLDNIQNDEERKINQNHVSRNGSISKDEKTIYFYDEAYDSIRMITKNN